MSPPTALHLRVLTWSPAAKLPGPSALDGLDPAARARADTLAIRYPLGDLLRVCGEVERDESLYALDLLDRYVGVSPTRGLDVGAKNGSTLPGLATFGGAWDAVEVDAHRRYWNLRTRRAVGEAMAGAFPGCRFVAADVRSLTGPYDLVTWFLPFVFEDPHRAWGLPGRLFDPAATLAHVVSLVAPGGTLFIVNQGESEAAEQQRLLPQAEPLGRIESPLSPYRRPRFGFRLRIAGERIPPPRA